MNARRRNLAIVGGVGALAVCACLAFAVLFTPDDEQPVVAETVREVTVEVPVTQLVEIVVTQISFVPVTVTPTRTPRQSPTPALTPTITLTPSETPLPSDTPPPSLTPDRAQTSTAVAPQRLTSPKGDGFYLVGVDIAAGVWRSTGDGADCYWSTNAVNGDIIDNHFGHAGGTAYVGASVFQVEFNRCGRWEYLGPP